MPSMLWIPTARSKSDSLLITHMSYSAYVLADGIVAEGVTLDDVGLDGELAGDESLLVVTSVIRDSFPAVRYVTYDVVRGLRLGDGKVPLTFRSIVKRVGHEFKHGEKMSLHDLEAVVYRHLKDAIVRVRTEERRLRVLICSEQLDPAAREIITDELERCIPEIGVMIANGILDRIEIVSLPFDQLPFDPTRAKQRLIR